MPVQRPPQHQISCFSDNLHAAQQKPRIQFVPQGAHNLMAYENCSKLQRPRERSFDLKNDFSNDIFMKVKRDNSGSASVSGRRTTANQDTLANYFKKVTE